MNPFDDAARAFDNLTRRVEQLESQLRTLRGEKAGPPRTHYRPSEVAAMTGFATKTIEAWARDGRIEAEKVEGEGGGGRWAIPAAAVEALTSRRSA